MTVVRIGGMVLLLASLALAGPCAVGSLQDYINLGAGGCTQGGYTFQDFLPAAGLPGATVIDPNAITVSPSGSASLRFDVNQSAAAGELFQTFFGFLVTGPLTNASIDLHGPAAAGDGAVTGILDACADGLFPGAPVMCPTFAGVAVAAHTAGFSQPHASLSLPVSSFFDVFVDLTIDGGLSGRAALEGASVTFNAVPEPSSAQLLLGGLGAVGYLRRRRLNK